MASAGSLVVALKLQADQARRGIKDTRRELKGLSSEAKFADSTVGGLNSTLLTTSTAAKAATVAIGALAAAGLSTNIIQVADSYQALQNKIKAVNDETVDLNSVSSDLFDVSQRSRQSITATIDLYSKLALSNQTLNLTQQELISTTEIVSKAVALSGSSAQASEAAIVQFAQAISNNFSAAAQEINSINEQAPALAKAIAQGLGVTSDQLKKLAAEGALNSKLVLGALQRSSEDVEKSFGRTNMLVSQSLTMLGNAITTYIGKADSANGATAALASGIASLAANFDQVAGVGSDALALTAAVIAARLTPSLINYTKSKTENIAASLGQAKAEKAAAAAALELARVEQRNTSLVLAQSKAWQANALAIKAATGNSYQLAAASTAVARANQANIGATNALTSATARYTTASAAATLSSRALSGAMALVGGPIGAAVLAASAIAYFVATAEDAETPTDRLTKKIDQLSSKLKELDRDQGPTKLLDLTARVEEAEGIASGLNTQTEALRKEILSQEKLLRQYESQLANQSNILNRGVFESRVEKQRELVGDLSKKLAEAEKSSADATKAYNNAKSALKEATSSSAKLSELSEDIADNAADLVLELKSQNDERSKAVLELQKQLEKIQQAKILEKDKADLVDIAARKYKQTLDEISRKERETARRKLEDQLKIIDGIRKEGKARLDALKLTKTGDFGAVNRENIFKQDQKQKVSSRGFEQAAASLAKSLQEGTGTSLTVARELFGLKLKLDTLKLLNIKEGVGFDIAGMQNVIGELTQQAKQRFSVEDMPAANLQDYLDEITSKFDKPTQATDNLRLSIEDLTKLIREQESLFGAGLTSEQSSEMKRVLDEFSITTRDNSSTNATKFDEIQRGFNNGVMTFSDGVNSFNGIIKEMKDGVKSFSNASEPKELGTMRIEIVADGGKIMEKIQGSPSALAALKGFIDRNTQNSARAAAQ